MFLRAEEWQKEQTDRIIKEKEAKHEYALLTITKNLGEAMLDNCKDSIVITAKTISSDSLKYEMYKTTHRGQIVQDNLNEFQSNMLELFDILRKNGYYMAIDKEDKFACISYHEKRYDRFENAFVSKEVAEEKLTSSGRTTFYIYEDDKLNAPIMKEITFEVPFATQPNVVANLGEGVVKEVAGLGVSNITEKGFKIWVTTPKEGDFLVNWVATKKG